MAVPIRAPRVLEEWRSALSRSVWARRYALAGAVLGSGAPAGLMLLRELAGVSVGPPVIGELERDPLLYGYMTASTIGAFSAFGAIVGVMRDRVEERSLTDALTQLWNRRHFESQLEIEVQRARRYRKPLTLLVLDLDRFKNVNDRYGHPEGDRVLRVISSMIRDSFRKTDVVCRYGGEEIAVIAPDTSFPEAMQLAERTRERISQTVMPASGEPFRVTVSIGLASLGEDTDATGLMRDADLALYRAKAEGRNACRGEDRTRRPNGAQRARLSPVF